MESARNDFKKFAFWKLVNMFSGLSLKDTFRQTPAADVLLIGPDVAKSEKTKGGLLFCRLFDSLAAELETLGLRVSHLNRSPSVLSPAQTYSGAFTYNRSHAIVLFLSVLLPKSRGFELRKNWAKRLVQMSGARIIFTQEGQAEIRAVAQEMGIPCVEVLHGIGYPNNGNVGWITGSEGVWPSHVLCFDKVSYETVKNAAPGGKTEVLLAKNYWLTNFLQPEKTSAVELLFPTFARRETYRHRVLITMARGHDEFSAESPLSKVWEILNDDKDSIFWWIRFHPVQLSSHRKIDRDTIRRAKNRFSGLNHVDIEQCQYMPLPLIARECTHHITIGSMSSYEMAEFGVPTLLLINKDKLKAGASGASYFDDIISEGFATLGALSEPRISSWIKTQTKLNPRGKSQEGDRLASILKRL